MLFILCKITEYNKICIVDHCTYIIITVDYSWLVECILEDKSY